MTPRSGAPAGSAPTKAGGSSGDPRLRNPVVEDVANIRNLPDGDSLGGLDVALQCRDFSRTSLVAESDGVVVGVLLGYRPPRSPEVYLARHWGTAASVDGIGLAVRMLTEALFDSPAGGPRRFETVISDDHPGSRITVVGAVAAVFGADVRRIREFTARTVGPLPDPASTYWFEY
ncbi:hypothetical protein HX744_12965 [Pseudonocardia sp. ICBG1122]|nr:hypothetical protein [Pseudonocardia pini]